ncbi:MAG: hypothetical protein IJS28_08120 [Synergistaceae bacterium]|nr:hypothetical protein [Synergistaceae bacterium]
MSAYAAYYDSGREGNSWASAYLISSAEDMIALKDRVNAGRESSGKYYVLDADIDLTSETSWEGINRFSGHFDGQNHTITMNSQSNRLYAALFHTVNTTNNYDAAIKNLNVIGTITANCAGTIVHYLYSGIVENCSFTGTVTPNNATSPYGAGGIAAHLEGGTVRNCRVSAEISGAAYAGGIVGEAESGTIENCTVEDSTHITARQVGGIAGKITSSSGVNISATSNHWPSAYPLSGSGYTPPSPQEEIMWNGHRYEVITESLTWEQAKTRCEELGGHLATITSQAEQNFVAGLLGDSGTYWLGARADESGFWHWVTDEPFEKQYTNYASGQPDGSGVYLQIDSSGKWDDVSGTSQGFICEWDDEPEEVKAAPVAESFREWLSNPELRENSDGAAPSPIDTSHLSSNPPRYTSSTAFIAADTLPARYDGREEIGLPEARNQGSYNTCWAFASLGAMEANYRKQGLASLGEYPDLSELHLAWFTYKTIYSKDIHPNLPVLDQLGTPDKAANFLTTSPTAPVREQDMPYTEAGKNAEIEAFLLGKTFTKAPLKLVDANKLDKINEGDISRVNSEIMKHGGVYVHYVHDESGYDEVNHSYYFGDPSGGSGHAVLLVGWDDDYPAENFTNNPGRNGAWLVRNSYGKDWGDNGYFWMSYEQARSRPVNNAYVFIVSEDISDETTEQREHDLGGETANITPQWSANVFRAERNESIVFITFNTTDNNADYQVYVNNLGKEKPADPGSVISEPVLSGNMPNAGYHAMRLSEPIELYAGDYYSVIVKMVTSYDYATAAESTVEGYFTASVSEGESYFASGDAVPSVWVDGNDMNGEAYNATVRVITIARPSYEFAPSITTSGLPFGRAGESYEFRLEAMGTGTIEWRAGELPEGFSFSREGVLSGQSDEAFDVLVKFTAFNDVGSDEAELRLVIVSEEKAEVKPEESNDVPPDERPEESEDVRPNDRPTKTEGKILDVLPERYAVPPSDGGCSAGLGSLGCVLVIMLLRRR